MNGHVALVGAGPGDAGLITVRGRERLRAAEVVIFDRLIDLTLLREAPLTALLVDAGKAPGDHRLTQRQINAQIVAHALAGRQVVRLKGGDPFVYGRGWEEHEACRAAGISCEVVPGVSSALAVPAAANIPVTARGVARSVLITTPRSSSGLDTDALGPDAAAADTVVLLMSRECLRDVCRRLVAQGRAASTPAAIVEQGTLPSQRSVRATLATLADEADRAGIANPCVVIVGDVVDCASSAGGHSTSLAGRRIVVTRPRTASADLIRRLVARGAQVIDAPLIDVVPRTPATWPVLRSYTWLIFTSLHGVRGFFAALAQRGLDIRAIGNSAIGAVGPKTASELQRHGLRADLVPDEHRAAALVTALVDRLGPVDRALFVGGSLALDTLPRGLRSHGVDLDVLEVYETRRLDLEPSARRAIEQGVDAILLYSPSAAVALHEARAAVGAAVLAAVGPTTARRIEQLGWKTPLVPERYGDDGMLALLEREFDLEGALT